MTSLNWREWIVVGNTLCAIVNCNELFPFSNVSCEYQDIWLCFYDLEKKMICKWPTLVKLGFSLLPKMAKNGQKWLKMAKRTKKKIYFCKQGGSVKNDVTPIVYQCQKWPKMAKRTKKNIFTFASRTRTRSQPTPGLPCQPPPRCWCRKNQRTFCRSKLFEHCLGHTWKDTIAN